MRKLKNLIYLELNSWKNYRKEHVEQSHLGPRQPYYFFFLNTLSRIVSIMIVLQHNCIHAAENRTKFVGEFLFKKKTGIKSTLHAHTILINNKRTMNRNGLCSAMFTRLYV